MFGQEDPPGLRVLIFHQLIHQTRCQHAILHRHTFERATGGIEGGVAQLFGIHLAQALKALKLQVLRIGMGLEKGQARLVVEQPGDLALVFH